MIEFIKYNKKYGDKTVLNDINLKLEKGKIYGFIGRNASGKTMLFKAICGFISKSSGKVLVDGKEIGVDIDFPKDTGIIIETPGFIENLSGFNNLKILASIKNVIDDKKIFEALRIVGLDPVDKRTVKKYSLGMKQKLAIAQAIMEEPKLLVLDEPMNALDEESVKNMRNLFLELKNKGTTILIASHNSEDINSLCDSIYKVDNGVVKKFEKQ